MKQLIETTFAFLHAHPELAFEEYETSAYLADALRKMGYQVRDGLGGTGVVGVLDSGKPGPVLALRADMDCLPFQVDGQQVSYHGCGHDGNMTMLLAAARLIQEQGIQSGKLYIIFQPAEESLEGSLRVIKTGALAEVEEIVGIHLQPEAEELPGHASPRLMHKAYGSVEILVHGRNAHASMPHLGVNATEAGVMIVNAVNCIRCDARSPYSCKVTVFKADGSSRNTIPDSAHLSFDLRADSNEVMAELISKLKNAAEGAAKAVGATLEYTREVVCYAADYDDALCESVKQALGEVLGPQNVHDATSCTCSEDFHHYKKELGAQASYISLGASFTPCLHAYNATFDHSYLEKGARVLARVAQLRLGGQG